MKKPTILTEKAAIPNWALQAENVCRGVDYIVAFVVALGNRLGSAYHWWTVYHRT